MAEKDGKRSWMMVNRAPVLTLWAAGVAELLGFEHDEALTLRRAVAGLNAYSKRVSLVLFPPTPRRSEKSAERCAKMNRRHRTVPAKQTDEGLRALSGESPIRPESVQKYLEGKFGEAFEDVTDAIGRLP